MFIAILDEVIKGIDKISFYDKNSNKTYCDVEVLKSVIHDLDDKEKERIVRELTGKSKKYF